MTDEREIPIANEAEYQCDPDKSLFLMWAGAYSSTECYVWADHLVDAFEEFVEWLDCHAPGCLTSFSEDDYKAAAKELGVEYPEDPDYSSEEWQAIAERAEQDHMHIGHTTLKHGTHIASYEWGGSEVTDQSELREIKDRSKAPSKFPETEFQAHLADIGACHEARELVGDKTVEQAIAYFLEIERIEDIKWLESNTPDCGIELQCREALSEHEKAAAVPRWAYGNGSPGCLHDHQSGPYDTANEAAIAAAELLELDDGEAFELNETHIVYLRGERVHEVGAGMVEVFEVDSDWTCD